MSDTYAQVMRSVGTTGVTVFDAAVADFRSGLDGIGEEFAAEDVPAPRRLAPYACAIAVTAHRGGTGPGDAGPDGTAPDGPGPDGPGPGHVAADDDTAGTEVGSGRLILLHDPAGQDGWSGTFRLVAYVRADVEPEVAADPLLGEVGWSWLIEALDAHVPGYTAESGTVTRVITEGFGAKLQELPLTGFELRASWSPVPRTRGGELDLGAHVVAWCACIAAAAGLEPPGTTALPVGRGRR
jgi:hypothetical protein